MVDIAKMRKMLQVGAVNVRFVKRDGTVRDMCATLNDAMFSYEHKGTTARRSADVTTVWDLDKNDWRSMRNDSIVEWSM